MRRIKLNKKDRLLQKLERPAFRNSGDNGRYFRYNLLKIPGKCRLATHPGSAVEKGQIIARSEFRGAAKIPLVGRVSYISSEIWGKWCCWGGLNSRPHPYQGCALPLSYSSFTSRCDLAANNALSKTYLDHHVFIM